MHEFPHRYLASAVGGPSATISTTSPDLPELAANTPPEFDGPPGFWSPETMLTGAVANCLILTWRSVAAHNGFEWTSISVDAVGVLDRVERVTRFTRFDLTVRLTVPAGTDAERADKLMRKAESVCLVTNSLNAEIFLELELVTA
ncbi:MAG: OsmC family protein [Propionibacteriales bacterium]|nr:OsmC family protein [Propionibacteriales bacterium]